MIWILKEKKYEKKLLDFFFKFCKLNLQTKDLSDEPTYIFFEYQLFSWHSVKFYFFLWLRLQRFFISKKNNYNIHRKNNVVIIMMMMIEGIWYVLFLVGNQIRSFELRLFFHSYRTPRNISVLFLMFIGSWYIA